MSPSSCARHLTQIEVGSDQIIWGYAVRFGSLLCRWWYIELVRAHRLLIHIFPEALMLMRGSAAWSFARWRLPYGRCSIYKWTGCTTQTPKNHLYIGHNQLSLDDEISSSVFPQDRCGRFPSALETRRHMHRRAQPKDAATWELGLLRPTSDMCEPGHPHHRQSVRRFNGEEVQTHPEFTKRRGSDDWSRRDACLVFRRHTGRSTAFPIRLYSISGM